MQTLFNANKLQLLVFLYLIFDPSVLYDDVSIIFRVPGKILIRSKKSKLSKGKANVSQSTSFASKGPGVG